MKVFLENETEESLPQWVSPLIQKVTDRTLSEMSYPEDYEVNVLIVDNETIHEMNRQYRQVNQETDVLSFPLFHPGEQPPTGSCLGDIVISLQKARQQAEGYGHSLEREIGFLTAHSLLHLLGYDHETEDDENEMFALQETVLQKIGLSR